MQSTDTVDFRANNRGVKLEMAYWLFCDISVWFQALSTVGLFELTVANCAVNAQVKRTDDKR